MGNIRETFFKKTCSEEIQLVLASASPRRLALLAQIGLDPHQVYATNIDETPKLREHPANLAKRLAKEKALKAQETFLWCNQNGKSNASAQKIVILAADTVVAVGRVILPKPESEDQAYECLRFLSGRSHKVYGAVCALNECGKITVKLVESRVRFRRLTSSLMEAYLNSGEWEGKAGGYAIQGKASAFVVHIAGSYSNVVGLPLAETMDLLTAYQYPLLSNWVAKTL
ncbi:Maf family nucleotide pyrophosphatase [Bartonella quintana]|uniref:dTTP/UTP pyrophosphatase n=3 Tax=Bartonella quintana TaxID=803 RepID=NTPPA_BARQU|nr:Maf family nucleotide pyrophosphatase [Bartonella quintana]Q6G132.1 RecName: Full=dTTP/UTP pyrophosphatase; Short=dTTPase/UTPase; AltName: Full=Nucleoside triphosphate pyrophosphatase; AltName: Full=Nucleotide pyrophosphatase; Short=Nucleotide PPase [Bartonella quintana str. Toulouse]ETS12489.1 maf-like protein [Bartonella quintana BQ2-D70]ETS15055.1 maf-like protein [Bartonella quintana JK 73rel]ETS17398.1 maf-like protein [Bartonella quintana JK 73]ETS17456.1 maf-like protein [Bartonella 